MKTFSATSSDDQRAASARATTDGDGESTGSTTSNISNISFSDMENVKATVCGARHATIENTNAGVSTRTHEQSDGGICVAAGTTHQGDPKFKGGNSQCVAMSACACVYSVYTNRKDFTTNEIDNIILPSGDALYMSLKHILPPGILFLDPEELSEDVNVGNYSAKIRVDWITNGLFPLRREHKEDKIRELTNIMENDVFNTNHIDEKDSIIFTGQNYTISFWRHNRFFYLFNSHAVDLNNCHFNTENEHVARLFKYTSCKSLVESLFARVSFYTNEITEHQYSLHRLRVTSPIPQPEAQTELTENETSFENQTNLQTMQILTDIQLIETSIIHSVPESQSPTILTNWLTSQKTNTSEKNSNQSQSQSILANIAITQFSDNESPLVNDSKLNSKLHTPNARKSHLKRGINPVVVIEKISDFKLSLLNPVVVIDKVDDFKLSTLKPVVVLQNSFSILSIDDDETDEPLSKKNKRGRPKKQKRGQKKTKENAHLDAVKKYNEKNPQVNRDSVKRYNEQNSQARRDAVERYNKQNPQVHQDAVQRYNERNPQVHQDAVQRYNERNPQVHQDAVQRYNERNPQVHQDAVQRYNERNPQVHQDAVQRYNERNPQVHHDAVQRYNERNPQVHQDAVQRYNERNPQVHHDAVQRYKERNPQIQRDAEQRYNERNSQAHRDAVQRYSQQHPEVNQAAVQRYEATSRNIDIQLRSSTNLIGEKQGTELECVRIFSLKKPSLLAPNTHTCPHCSTRLFEEEKGRKQWCCGSNAYNVQHLTPLTEEFYSHPAFLKRARAYNNLFAFSALGVTHGYQHPEGLSFIKIQGRIYHRIFDLSYTESTNNIGLYINDSEERENLARGQNLDLDVIRSITNFLHNENPYIECFKRLSREPSDEAHIIFEKTSRATHGNILGDLPLGREIAAFISTEKETFVPRCIAVWKIGEGRPHTIDIMHALYESFQYPLLYPQGNRGWSLDMMDNNENKLTQVKYVRCLLLSETRFSVLGRLSEEWLVDLYCRILEERLRFIHNIQKRNSNNALRAAPLQEIETCAEQIQRDETIQGEGIVPGRIYLPSTFTGGPRYMKQKYMDAIALVNRLGTPSFLLTFTCNTKWIEIQQSVQFGRVNPLICARVFNLKLGEILRDIRSGRWFGKCIYIMHVIEFQKRGLPHAHICFRVEGGGPVQNMDIDKFLRADIPDESEAGGRLRKAVLSHMIHGPCGPSNRTNLPCWDDNKKKCTKYFPKKETPMTYCDDKGFTNLKRNSKNLGIIKYRGREITVNDLWVVPYNASLLLKYDAHINLEISSQRTIVKYLFKYITKGPDESRVAIVPEEHRDNEIEQYVTKRYIGSSDAAWRVLEFDVTAREPNVKQLTVHLENKNTVIFKPGTESESAQRSTSDLIIYFNRPSGEQFDRLTYLDFYEQYLVHAKRPSTKNVEIYETTNNKFVTKRQRGEMVARLFWVSPQRNEQFYLRMLLNIYPCRSYSDLYNLGGPNCTTFQEAAKAVGLADDEVEYERAMLEASSFFTGPRLRSFFVLLAVNGIAIALLWETFKDQLSEDFLHRMPDQRETAYNRCLMDINRRLLKHGSSLVEHGLPDVIDDTTELSRERVEYSVDRLTAFVDEWLPQLSSEQREIYDYIDKLCVDKSFRESNIAGIFVDGPAGTGKTLLLNVVTAHVRGNLKGIVLCTASSAIAAQNYEGGTTAHSMFKFPIDILDDLGYWNLTNGTQRAELILNADVIIYDEAPMAHKYLIHLLDRSLRDLMKCDKIFGGKVIIFAGDFRQIPPVVLNAKSNFDILNCSVKTSPIWHSLKTFSLLTSQRCREDAEFAEFLLDLGSNRLPSTAVCENRTIQHLIELKSIEFVSELDDLIDFVFPSVIIDESDVCTHRAILSTRNDSTKEINAKILDRLPGDTLHFYSYDKMDTDNVDEVFFGVDALNRMQPRGIPEHDLHLKIGCVCMIMRNLSFSDGLVNGTKVIVVRTSPRLITVRKRASEGDEEYLIPRILFKASIDPNSPLQMCRRQFPLQVCYAMTIHKSQGQTISRVGLDLRSDIFSHGQLYVGLGRVRNRRDIRILLHKDRILNNKPYANNVVISGLL